MIQEVGDGLRQISLLERYYLDTEKGDYRVKASVINAFSSSSCK
jgi:hypothetical protein